MVGAPALLTASHSGIYAEAPSRLQDGGDSVGRRRRLLRSVGAGGRTAMVRSRDPRRHRDEFVARPASTSVIERVRALPPAHKYSSCCSGAASSRSWRSVSVRAKAKKPTHTWRTRPGMLEGLGESLIIAVNAFLASPNRSYALKNLVMLSPWLSRRNVTEATWDGV